MQQILCRWSFHLLQLNGKTIEPKGSHLRYLMVVYFWSVCISNNMASSLMVCLVCNSGFSHNFSQKTARNHFFQYLVILWSRFKKTLQQETNEICYLKNHQHFQVRITRIKIDKFNIKRYPFWFNNCITKIT